MNYDNIRENIKLRLDEDGISSTEHELDKLTESVIENLEDHFDGLLDRIDMFLDD